MQDRFVRSLFLDSGAFSLRRDVRQYRKEHSDSTILDYYNSDAFWHYIDSYAQFLKRYALAVDHYANLDVIGHPELSWRNLKYLEVKHKLNPVPVIHARTDMKWVRRYLKHGYPFIAVGGLVMNTRKPQVISWLREFFSLICPPPSGLPQVKVHAFGMMSGPLLFRYPFWSADATNVEKLARYGKIIIPRKGKNREYDYSRECYIVALSPRVTTHKLNVNWRCVNAKTREAIQNWLDHINESGFFKKRMDFKTNDEYKVANYFFYEQLKRNLPPWPFAFRSGRTRECLI